VLTRAARSYQEHVRTGAKGASRCTESNRAMRRTKAQPHHARRRSCPPRIRTSTARCRAGRPAVRREGIKYGKRDSYYIPTVEKAGIEPARQRLQGAPGALPVIPRAAASLIIL
jgi:hypothetical protein